MLMVVLLDHILAQSVHHHFSDDAYHWMDRFDVLYDNPTQTFTGIRPYLREDVVEMIRMLDSSGISISKIDRAHMQWLANANNHWLSMTSGDEGFKYIDSTHTFYTLTDVGDVGSLSPQKSKKPFLKHFYKSPAFFFEVDKPNFYLRVNPLLQFRLANVNDDDQMIFENQRGIRIYGGIDNKIYFHTEILESQARYPDYINRFRRTFNALPGAGFTKSYQSRLFDFDNGVDYLLANAYFGVNISKHVSLELGHGEHFLGHGIRSLFLSDFSTQYFYLKLNTRIWKFHYQNIFAELTRPDREIGLGDQLLPKKYFAAHYLGLNILKNLSVGLFETVVFARENQFELQYLNPVILYRTVEGSIGSPDNVLLGIDMKWNLWRSISLYSQFILDEFKINEITAGNGWWANKYAWQAGLKYFNLWGVDHLDVQMEYNVARPYTYSHNTGVANYSHYNQPLAHPLGANLREMLIRVRYQPHPRWSLILRANRMRTGEDIDTVSWGANILLPNNDHPQDYGNEVGQGADAKINMLGIDASFEWKHGLYLDFFYQSRRKESAVSSLDNQTHYFGGGIRWNLGRSWLEF